jgi:K+ transporter
LILLSNVVLELTGPVLSADTVFWPALVVLSAVGGMASLALTSWFWLRRDGPDRMVESST